MHFGCADVDACFHRLRLRGKICEYLFAESQSKQSGWVKFLWMVLVFLPISWFTPPKCHFRWVSVGLPILPKRSHVNYFASHFRLCAASLSQIGLSKKYFFVKITQQSTTHTLITGAFWVAIERDGEGSHAC